jgi:glycosyltransferase involved in cell wall biosynthesis
MRVGQNPAKYINQVAKPARVTVAVVTYIPFLSGYYEHSLEVLKVCLGSIWENTDPPYDLLVFDNASCLEVRAWLEEAHGRKQIRYLVLSDENIGKAGAWNFIFGAAPGEFVAYADSDVYFYPGWLPAHLEAFENLPSLGMITGRPLRIPEEYSTGTVRWAESTPEVSLERGRLLPWQDFWQHARSLGLTESEARSLFDENDDLCLIYQGRRYYLGAAHYQFVARSEVLRSILPVPSERPMGQVRALDIAINASGYLRLCTEQWWAQHLGNTLEAVPEDAQRPEQVVQLASARRPGAWLQLLIQKLYHWSFNWLYRHGSQP